MRIFISGPITGVDNYLDNFKKAETLLKTQGYEPINPAEYSHTLPNTLTHEEYMVLGYTLLSICDGVYFMDGWEESMGCNQEYGYAVAKGLIIINK